MNLGTTKDLAAMDIEELRTEARALREHVREQSKENQKYRTKASERLARVKELEAQAAKPATKGDTDVSGELEALRRENRSLKHRSVFERVARDAGAKTAGKALDTLWDALKYEADGEADPAELTKRIEAAKADYSFLFNDPADSETARTDDTPANDLNRAMRDQFTRPATPVKPPGPGVGRGASADGAGKLVVRKSELQSFDPRVNPMLDPNRAAAVAQAKKDGRYQYIED